MPLITGGSDGALASARCGEHDVTPVAAIPTALFSMLIDRRIRTLAGVPTSKRGESEKTMRRVIFLGTIVLVTAMAGSALAAERPVDTAADRVVDHRTDRVTDRETDKATDRHRHRCERYRHDHRDDVVTDEKRQDPHRHRCLTEPHRHPHRHHHHCIVDDHRHDDLADRHLHRCVKDPHRHDHRSYRVF